MIHSEINAVLCYIGQMQPQCQSERAEIGWRLHSTEVLKQAVQSGQTLQVHQMLREGVPLVTDAVSLYRCSCLRFHR